MLSSKLVSVKNSPSYRHCRPARVSSKQDSGKAGPETEKGMLYKHRVGFILYARTELYYAI